MKRIIALLLALLLACAAVFAALAEAEPFEVLPEAADDAPEEVGGALLAEDAPETLADEAVGEVEADDIDATDGPEPVSNAIGPDDGVTIDAVSFPATDFRNYVLANIDTDRNGVLSTTEANAVKRIVLVDDSEFDGGSAEEPILNCGTLKGIEFFPRLRVLECPSCGLTELDLSRNTALVELRCGFNLLTKLDFSQNALLKELDCSVNRLETLNLSGNTALQTLHCGDNQLTKLDLSKNTALKELDCAENKLTKLDLSKNTALNALYCSHNRLEKLDVRKNAKLSSLECHNNKLTSLSLNKQLKYLSCDGNPLKALDLKDCPKLISIIDKYEPEFESKEVRWSDGGGSGIWISKTTRLEAGKRCLYPFQSEKALSLTVKQSDVQVVELTVLDQGVVTCSVSKSKIARCVVSPGSENRVTVTVTGLAPGSTKVKLVHKATKQTVTLDVKVTKVTKPTSVSFKQGKAVTIRSWETLHLKPVFKPAKAWSRLTWNCSDPSLALVDQDGNVYPKNSDNGTVTITATTSNGKSARIEVTLWSTRAHAGNIEGYIDWPVTTMKEQMTMPMYPQGSEFIYESGGAYPTILKAGVDSGGNIRYLDLTGNSMQLALFSIYPGMSSSLEISQIRKHGWTFSNVEIQRTSFTYIYTHSGYKYKLYVTIADSRVTRVFYGNRP